MKMIKLWLEETQEHVLAVPMFQNTAKLYSIPAYTQTLCSDDVVQFDENRVITHIIERGGDRARHGTFRFEGTHEEIQQRFDRIAGYMNQHGIAIEHHEEYDVAMAVPEQVSDEQLKWFCEECRVLLFINDENGKRQIVSDLPPDDWPLTGTNPDAEAW